MSSTYMRPTLLHCVLLLTMQLSNYIIRKNNGFEEKSGDPSYQQSGKGTILVGYLFIQFENLR